MGQETPKCAIIGAGPVGALAAIYAAKRGWDVQVYELRGDLREQGTVPLNFTKSINLALSERGINAMRHSGPGELVDKVLADTIPMYGRMIHGQDPQGALTEDAQLYDVHGRFIRAVDRANLNSILLDQLEGLGNVKLNFHCKLTGADFTRKKAWFESTPNKSRPQTPGREQAASPDRPKEFEIDFDILLGCDGAHSAARFHLMKYVRMDYDQKYIDVLWCEFTIPKASDLSELGAQTSPSAKDDFATSPNHLHIWPSADAMFIAIPSIDNTFTCTLFAPAAVFSRLEQSPDAVEPYFQTHFPGAAGLIGSQQLRLQFQRNPHLPLISIKCSPHHFEGSGVILGDAAHAMVPFYGQGMNAGLEDVRVLFEHIDAAASQSAGTPTNEPIAYTSDKLADALQAYTKTRVPDAHTINDLALNNYWEMHAGVRSPLYLFRKRIEEFLSDKLPSTGFATQYSRVSFSNQRYSEVSKVVAEQGKLLFRGIIGSVVVPTAVLAAVWLGRADKGNRLRNALRWWRDLWHGR
ncbi:kynurenine 3-monooxygenase [Polychaeton citri CBS 116435]|uniref:Kynurenine 3-monooxygenase n=1 Tax=Polychaeton citri CBS 116435 TaxID=1314669 RepID=A0A9P4UM32_9PEZI|nr:kynurenine 3-monooxygenase [Polychaeton citri CBS 116435]